jgi:hypothetical protein
VTAPSQKSSRRRSLREDQPPRPDSTFKFSAETGGAEARLGVSENPSDLNMFERKTGRCSAPSKVCNRRLASAPTYCGALC